MLHSSSSGSLSAKASGKSTPILSSGKSTPYSVGSATPNAYHENGMYYWFDDYLNNIAGGETSLLDTELNAKILTYSAKKSMPTALHSDGLKYYMLQMAPIDTAVSTSSFGGHDVGEDLEIKDHHISIYEEVSSPSEHAGLHYTVEGILHKDCIAATSSSPGEKWKYPKGGYKAHAYFTWDTAPVTTDGFFFPIKINLKEGIQADLNPIFHSHDGGQVCQTLIQKFQEDSDRLLGKIGSLIKQAQEQEVLAETLDMDDSSAVGAHLQLMNGYIQELDPLLAQAQRWQLPTTAKNKTIINLKSQLTFFTAPGASATGTPLKPAYSSAILTPYSVTGLVSPEQGGGLGGFGALQRETSESGCSDEGRDDFELPEDMILHTCSSDSFGALTPHSNSKSPYGKGKQGGSPSFWKGAASASPSKGAMKKTSSSPDFFKVTRICDEVSRFEERRRSTKSDPAMTEAENMRIYCERELIEPYKKLEQMRQSACLGDVMLEEGQSRICEHLVRRIYSQPDLTFRESEIFRDFIETQFFGLGKVALTTCGPLELYEFMGYYRQIVEAKPEISADASSNMDNLLAYAMNSGSRNFAPLALISRNFHKTLDKDSVSDLYPSLSLETERSTLENCIFVSECLGIAERELAKDCEPSWQEQHSVLANYISIWKTYQGVLKEILAGDELSTLIDRDEPELMEALRALMGKALELEEESTANVEGTVHKLRTLGSAHEFYRESPLLETYSEKVKEMPSRLFAWTKVASYLREEGSVKKLNSKLKSIKDLSERHAELSVMIESRKKGEEVSQEQLERLETVKEQEWQQAAEVLQALVFFQLFFERKPDGQSLGTLKMLRTTIADLQKEHEDTFAPLSYFLSWLLSPKEKLPTGIETPTPYALIDSHRRELSDVLYASHCALEERRVAICLNQLTTESKEMSLQSATDDSDENHEISTILSAVEIMKPSLIMGGSPRSPKKGSPKVEGASSPALIFSSLITTIEKAPTCAQRKTPSPILGDKSFAIEKSCTLV